MEAVATSSLPYPSRKRSFEDATIQPFSHSQASLVPNEPMSTYAEPTGSSRAAHGIQIESAPTSDSTRQTSPTPSTSSSLTSISATPPPSNLMANAASHPPAKRRKLTAPEKEERDREKAAKKAQKDGEKAQKDVEKARKEEERSAKRAQQDEERRQKNEVREEKRRERELKDHEKEEKKRKEEEEKLKKERAQLRMTAFFAKPRPSLANGETSVPANSNVAGSHVPRLKSNDQASADHSQSSQSRVTSDYDRYFLPFATPSHATIAPINRFTWDTDATKFSVSKADEWFRESEQSCTTDPNILQNLQLAPWETAPRGLSQSTAKDVLGEITGSSDGSMDLTETKPMDNIRQIPMKYIYFHHDVRPPYVGSRTNINKSRDYLTLGRNPFIRARSEIEYDYDSEAEWDEPEEGEELDNESLADSEHESQDGAEEMEDFLDDDGATDLPKTRKKIYGEMDPIVSGICWENERKELINSHHLIALHPQDYRMELIGDSNQFPLDPLSSSLYYTEPPESETASPAPVANSQRMPLQARSNDLANVLGSLKPPDHIKAGKPKKDLRVLSGDELERFKKAIEGSDLNKQGLLAVIKKQFPKVPNAVLGGTLGAVAKRMGNKEAEKRWVVVD